MPLLGDASVVTDAAAALGVLCGAVGVITYVRAIGKSQALRAWRDTALGYKEQNAELNGRLHMAEERLLLSEKKVADLEKRPDMTKVIELVATESVKSLTAVEGVIRHDGDKTRTAVRELGKAVDALLPGKT